MFRNSKILNSNKHLDDAGNKLRFLNEFVTKNEKEEYYGGNDFLREKHLKDKANAQPSASRNLQKTPFHEYNDNDFLREKHLKSKLTKCPAWLDKSYCEAESKNQLENIDITSRKRLQKVASSEVKNVPCWKEFSAKEYLGFRTSWYDYKQKGGLQSIGECTAFSCKFQATFFYDNLFEKSNDDILKIADHHFDVPKEDYNFTRMKPTKNFNQVNKPTLNTHEDYVKRYASFLNSVDKDLWPTISNLLEIFEDGLASKTFKKTFNKFDPVEEKWQRNSKDYERNIFNDDGNFFKRRNYYKKFHNSNRYHRSYGKYNKDHTRNESKKSTSKEYYYKLKRKSSNCTLMDSTNGSKDTGRRIKESSSGTNLTISDVFLNHDYAIDIPDVDDSDDDVLVNLDARNRLDRLAIDIN